MTDSSQPVDTVVYDFGNVLVAWDPYGAFPRRSRAEVDAWMAEIDFPAFNHAQDAGRSWADARASLTDRPHPLLLLDEYVAGFDGTLTGPVEGSAELVEELRAADVRLLGLTNWSAELFAHAATAAPATARMEQVVVSGRVGLAKPDPAIFRHLAATHDVDPARAVFVDDSPANVAAAASLGFHAVRFTGTPTLRTALRARGLPVAPPE
ncbi:HAD family hydrolase [Krasilnikoviella flava]|uniref:2-haloacid dehalogenase n=1 Tax=Krasilnikoviella flava TaxID=526729 RepID=A0A1T5L799_9MICO|nr:HAD family phosphatase [Krasilnikoviella flava]SKC71298.1 2-haloacid dehalogenase [Krasilnikoviella flava]